MANSNTADDIFIFSKNLVGVTYMKKKESQDENVPEAI